MHLTIRKSHFFLKKIIIVIKRNYAIQNSQIFCLRISGLRTMQSHLYHKRCSSITSHPQLIPDPLPLPSALNVPAMYVLNVAIPFANTALNNINTCLEGFTVFIILRHANFKLVFMDIVTCQYHPQIPLLIPALPRKIKATFHPQYDRAFNNIFHRQRLSMMQPVLVRRVCPYYHKIYALYKEKQAP